MKTYSAEFHRLFRKRKAIARELIGGPRVIAPPKDLSSHDWFETDLRITLHSNPYGTIESISVYSDSTMNKTEDFFAPILRHCVWQQNDNSSENGWPNAPVRLGSIKNQAVVHDCLMRIQRSIHLMAFPPIGLSLARDVPDVEYAPKDRMYSMKVRNGLQSIEYHSTQLEHDPFADLVFESYDLLVAQLEEFDKRGWTEGYSQDLSAEAFPNRAWYWNYES